MSECVVRMEMPNSCYDCEIRGDKAYCPICGATLVGYKRSRHENCPILCQLPEGHGRLVDEKSVRWTIDDIVLEIAQRTGRVEMTKDETMEYVNSLYTIVPAERSET